MADDVTGALLKVMADLPGIGKDLRAAQQQGGYAYRGIEMIANEASPLFAKHGVMFTPRVVSWETREFTINNKPWTDERLMVEYKVYGPGGKDDFIVIGPIAAIGRDNSDKGCNKALTQAFKYAMIQSLCIADSKDDADGTTHERDAVPPTPTWQPAPKVRIDTVKAAVIEAGLAQWVKDQGFPWPWPDEACNAIEEKLHEMSEGGDGQGEPADSPQDGDVASPSPSGDYADDEPF
jgi:hypothetical protein